MAKLKIISWNVNGIRAQLKKGFSDFIQTCNADIFIFQETKASVDIVKEIGASFPEYHIYANEAEKKGYSGTAIFSKEKAITEIYNIGKSTHDTEGRIVALEFEHYFLVNVYVPNSGSDMNRLDYRKKWDKDFLDFNKNLASKKPVIIGGDFNVAHMAIDLKRPKENYNKTSGYTQVEIDGMDNFHKAGFIDSYRTLHPEEVKYTFWSMRFGARARNAGWRIDYFLLSKGMRENLKSADIHNEVMGSDHCPLSIELEF